MKLKFYASKDKNALHPNYAAFEAGVRRFIGWSFNASLNEGQGGWERKEEAEEVNASPLHVADYLHAVLAGDLIPADQETADKFGVSFKQ